MSRPRIHIPLFGSFIFNYLDEDDLKLPAFQFNRAYEIADRYRLEPPLMDVADAFIAMQASHGPVVHGMEINPCLADEVYGLAIALGHGAVYGERHHELLNYVRERLGLDPIPFPDQPECRPEYRAESCEVPGQVYILCNASMPGLLKIGMTTKGVQERIKQLSAGTSVPTPFELVRAFSTPTPKRHERLVHEVMARFRLCGREFFQVDQGFALRVCSDVIGEYE